MIKKTETVMEIFQTYREILKTTYYVHGCFERGTNEIRKSKLNFERKLATCVRMVKYMIGPLKDNGGYNK